MKTNEHLSIGARTSPFNSLSPKRCGLKSALLLALCVTAALSLLTHAAFAQTWQTVDDFQYVLGHHSWNVGLAVTPNGSLFASGYALDSAGIYHALVMVSADAGANWSGAIDDYLYG